MDEGSLIAFSLAGLLISSVVFYIITKAAIKDALREFDREKNLKEKKPKENVAEKVTTKKSKKK